MVLSESESEAFSTHSDFAHSGAPYRARDFLCLDCVPRGLQAVHGDVSVASRSHPSRALPSTSCATPAAALPRSRGRCPVRRRGDGSTVRVSFLCCHTSFAIALDHPSDRPISYRVTTVEQGTVLEDELVSRPPGQDAKGSRQ